MKGKIVKLDRTGHQEVEWDTEVEETVDAAREHFAQLLLGGHLPTTGSPAKMMEGFDPEAGTITFVPPLRGG